MANLTLVKHDKLYRLGGDTDANADEYSSLHDNTDANANADGANLNTHGYSYWTNNHSLTNPHWADANANADTDRSNSNPLADRRANTDVNAC